jgi:hypothetical protein
VKAEAQNEEGGRGLTAEARRDKAATKVNLEFGNQEIRTHLFGNQELRKHLPEFLISKFLISKFQKVLIANNLLP